MTHDPLCERHIKTKCFDQEETCFECLIIEKTKSNVLQKVIITLQSANLCSETYYDCSVRAVEAVKDLGNN